MVSIFWKCIMRPLAVTLCLLVFLFGLSVAASADDGLNAKVDALFATWDKPDSPGCALAIIKDRQVVYKRGYGRANLEFDVPITPSTVFYLASVSKQFTAFCTHVLAQEGKLSLDDDVRKYVPELHDFGKTITIRHLIHHTSGLRDYFGLMALGGWGGDGDSYRIADVLNFIWRQRELNFAPGEKYIYSNTGYMLLSVIVQRVSGKTLREFAEERIFQPLGMKQTRFRDDHLLVMKNCADSYGQRGSEFRRAPMVLEQVGSGGLLSTVEDLAKWDQNFYETKVGGPALIAAMQQKGRLNSGKEIAYASGLGIGDYKGLRTVEHTGGSAGYRTVLLRFPKQKFSVIILSNLASFNPSGMARRIAELYLEQPIKAAATLGTVGPKPQAVRRTAVTIDPKLLDAYVGKFSFPGYARAFEKIGDHLMLKSGGEAIRLFPASETQFFMEAFPATYTFVRPKQGDVMQVIHEVDGEQAIGERIVSAPLTPKQLADSTGTFYSEELDAFCTLLVRDGRLVIQFLKLEAPLLSINPNLFQLDAPERSIPLHCQRDKAGRVITLSLDVTERVQRLRFVRVEIKGNGLNAKRTLYSSAYRGTDGKMADWGVWLPPTDLDALKELPDTESALTQTLKQCLADLAVNKPDTKGVRTELLAALATRTRTACGELLKEMKTFVPVLKQEVSRRNMMAYTIPIYRVLIYRAVNAKETKYVIFSLASGDRIADVEIRNE